MTKMKSKKMTKSTFAIIIMGIVMVAMLAFGGTFAYFTATAAPKSSSITTGTIKLTVNDVVTSSSTNAVYGDVVLGAITYDATGTNAASYVFVKLTATSTGATFTELFGADLAVKEGWTKVDGLTLDANTTVYSREVAATGATTYPFLDELKITASPNWVQDGEQPKEMNASVTVTLAAKSIQKTGLATAADAYNALTW